MKYTKELTDRISALYSGGTGVEEIVGILSIEGLDVSPRSVIAKLSSLGLYRKKAYLTKRGEVPVKKEEYVERIAALLDANLEILESLEKVNKSVLALIEKKLLEKSDPKSD